MTPSLQDIQERIVGEMDICSLGFGCKAQQVKHFLENMHAPHHIRKALRKQGLPTTDTVK